MGGVLLRLTRGMTSLLLLYPCSLWKTRRPFPTLDMLLALLAFFAGTYKIRFETWKNSRPCSLSIRCLLHRNLGMTLLRPFPHYGIKLEMKEAADALSKSAETEKLKPQSSSFQRESSLNSSTFLSTCLFYEHNWITDSCLFHACFMLVSCLFHACFMLVSCLFHACAAVWSPAAFGQICWGRSEAGRDFQPRAAPDVCAVQRRATAVLCAASTIPAAVPACVCWCRKSTASAVCDADASDASDAAIPCNVFGLLRWCLHGKSSLWTATASTVWTAATTGSAPATVRAVAIPTASSAASAATAERHGRRSLRTGPGHSAIWLDSHAPSSTLCAGDTCATASWPISRLSDKGNML